jgi:hypothetical protein
MFFDKVLKVVENEILHLITTYKRMKMHFMWFFHSILFESEW